MSRYLVLDLETVPIANAADYLPLDEIEPDGRLKDPEKIKADIAAKQQKRIDEAALDLDLARVIAVGRMTCESAHPDVQYADDLDGEREMVAMLAAQLDPRENHILITFNGHKYDLPLLMRRAKYLGVPFPKINLDRYRSPHIDLYDELTLKGAVKAHSLRWYMRRLSWTDLLEADPFKDSSEVGAAVAAGRWDDVAAHCRVDVTATLRLAKWMGVIS